MSRKSIDDYKSLLEQISDFKESASGDELKYLIEAETNIKQSEYAQVQERREVTETLYESGYMDYPDYEKYVNFLESTSNTLEQDLHPYMTEAALSMVTTIVKAENRAYNSKKFEDVLKMPNGKISGSLKSFVLSRLNKIYNLKTLTTKPSELHTGKKWDWNQLGSKYDERVKNGEFVVYGIKNKPCIVLAMKDDIVVKSVVIDPKFKDEAYVSYAIVSTSNINSGVKQCLKKAKAEWMKKTKECEKVVKEHVSSAIEDYGSASIIYERTSEAIDRGVTSAFAAKTFLDLVDICEFVADVEKEW